MVFLSIRSKLEAMAGEWLVGAFVDPAVPALAVNWALATAAIVTRLTRRMSEMPVPAGNVLTLLPDQLLVLELSTGDGMKLLPSELSRVSMRRPNWRTDTRPAGMWFMLTGNTLGIDGSPGTSGKVRVTYVERPALLVNDADEVDPRLRDINEEAIVMLAAAYLLRHAADAQDLDKARMFQNDAYRILNPAAQPEA